jgi:hypothetical protein
VSVWDNIKGVALGFVEWLSPVIDLIICPFKQIGNVIGGIIGTAGGWFGETADMGKTGIARMSENKAVMDAAAKPGETAAPITQTAASPLAVPSFSAAPVVPVTETASPITAPAFTAANVITPVMDMAELNRQVQTSPFSVPARRCVDLMIAALWEHGAEGLTCFFDEKDIFHFRTPRDTGKNEGGTETFESGKNIVRSGSGWIEVLPRPIRHTQDITVNGRPLITARTDLTVSRTSTRLRLFLREAAA